MIPFTMITSRDAPKDDFFSTEGFKRKSIEDGFMCRTGYINFVRQFGPPVEVDALKVRVEAILDIPEHIKDLPYHWMIGTITDPKPTDRDYTDVNLIYGPEPIRISGGMSLFVRDAMLEFPIRVMFRLVPPEWETDLEETIRVLEGMKT